ncbi:hypothetical protein KGG70_gp45 [Streptomyces phage Celia]|uniref:Uncharacterized protein n=1 Tax=Streptomyces phage Celia TaxID=2590946 RepID=A0A516KRC4_9CAUD|nr:hypothetical protein KGG70_gp45 [Streptomyces phage Celia]QDP44239.1 hypothetical protein SEA_CELIA_36 [Streptomyces phage Celia]QJD50601.1 hypothetical protein SEA_ITZA_36 [Streptomyces phage Itza]
MNTRCRAWKLGWFRIYRCEHDAAHVRGGKWHCQYGRRGRTWLVKDSERPQRGDTEC